MPTAYRTASQRPPAAIEKVVMARPRRRVMGHRAMIEKVMSRVRRLQGCHEGLLRKGAPRMFAPLAVVGLVFLVFDIDASKLLDRRGMQVHAQVDVGIRVSRIDQQRRRALRLVDLSRSLASRMATGLAPH